MSVIAVIAWLRASNRGQPSTGYRSPWHLALSRVTPLISIAIESSSVRTAMGQTSTGPGPRPSRELLTAVSQTAWTALDWVSSMGTRWTLTCGNGFVSTAWTLGRRLEVKGSREAPGSHREIICSVAEEIRPSPPVPL